ncbi:unnamed protein product [Pieris macdunnoughi]|uniref:Uncharacterized protein n=1 Tax=Pieris macdunnoughi TaxID=345717 RepID=A0A821U8Z2_9NEOP|nr:unnamed protein product [Pieris macdunnoughi]
MSLKGKVVIITGASAGIGAAIAIEFSKKNSDVILVGRNETRLNEVAMQCEANGCYPTVINADITIDSEAARVIQETVKKFNKIDILINNAGILRKSSLIDGSFLEAFDEILKLNLRAAVNLVNLATPHLIASKGNIVNISGVAGRQILGVDYAAYSMLKASLDHFTRGAALEVGKYGVRVNTVSPGPVKTEIYDGASITIGQAKATLKTALNRWSYPEEIADVVLFLASDKAVGVTGSNYTVDNGLLVMK